MEFEAPITTFCIYFYVLFSNYTFHRFLAFLRGMLHAIAHSHDIAINYKGAEVVYLNLTATLNTLPRCFPQLSYKPGQKYSTLLLCIVQRKHGGIME